MQNQEINKHYSCKCIKIWHHKTSKSIDISSDPYHDSYELYYLVSGEQYFFVKDKTYYIKSGDLVFVEAGALHKIMPTKIHTHESIKINFSRKFFNHFIKEILAINSNVPLPFDNYPNVIRFSDDNQKTIEDIFHKVMAECSCKKRGHALYIKILMIELFIFLIRTLEESPHLYLVHPSPLHNKISDIIRYINNNYDHNLSLISLSEKFNISPYYLSRVFKEITGFSYTEYISILRIKKAKELLMKTQLNVTEIAKMIGYNNINQFGRIFKNMTGIPPTAFRKANNI